MCFSWPSGLVNPTYFDTQLILQSLRIELRYYNVSVDTHIQLPSEVEINSGQDSPKSCIDTCLTLFSQLDIAFEEACNALDSLGTLIYNALEAGYGWLFEGLVDSAACDAELDALQADLRAMVRSIGAAQQVQGWLTRPCLGHLV